MKKLDGQVFLAAGRTWRIFSPGWRLWRWAGWLWRRLRGVPAMTRRLALPGAVVTVRGEAFGRPARTPRLARQAPLTASAPRQAGDGRQGPYRGRRAP